MDRLISEQKVLKIIDNLKANFTCYDFVTLDEVTSHIKAVPSAEPKTGYWIYDRTRDWDGECKYECSECGMGSDIDYAYCMRCGTKMESEKNKPMKISYVIEQDLNEYTGNIEIIEKQY